MSVVVVLAWWSSVNRHSLQLNSTPARRGILRVVLRTRETGNVRIANEKWRLVRLRGHAVAINCVLPVPQAVCAIFLHCFHKKSAHKLILNVVIHFYRTQQARSYAVHPNDGESSRILGYIEFPHCFPLLPPT